MNNSRLMRSKFARFTTLLSLLYAGGKENLKTLKDDELIELGKLSRRNGGNDAGDHFYKNLPQKRVKGKWSVKR